MKRVKKLLKIITGILVILFLVVYMLFYFFSHPKSNSRLQKSFNELGVEPVIQIHEFRVDTFRSIAVQKRIDTNKVTMVFVHGAIGSAADFKKYMTDSIMRSVFNMIAYDRIGYNYNSKKLANPSLQFEIELLEDFIKEFDPNKTILVGYSYGGPIVLGVKKKMKQVVLLAPAVYSKVEPMPFMLRFYQWPLTRWMVPHVWKSASIEKIAHIEELRKFENNWSQNPSQIIAIHGNEDGIVPFENSLFLQNQFPNSQFKLKRIEKAGHGLLWSNFKMIKKEFLKLTN